MSKKLQKDTWYRIDKWPRGYYMKATGHGVNHSDSIADGVFIKNQNSTWQYDVHEHRLVPIEEIAHILPEDHPDLLPSKDINEIISEFLK